MIDIYSALQDFATSLRDILLISDKPNVDTDTFRHLHGRFSPSNPVI